MFEDRFRINKKRYFFVPDVKKKKKFKLSIFDNFFSETQENLDLTISITKFYASCNTNRT